MENNKMTLIPRDELMAKAQAFNDQRYQEGIDKMKADMCEAVTEAFKNAEEHGVVYLPDGLIIPEVFRDGHNEYYIPDEVMQWAADAGYALHKCSGKRYYLQ